MENDQRLNALVHEGDPLHYSKKTDHIYTSLDENEYHTIYKHNNLYCETDTQILQTVHNSVLFSIDDVQLVIDTVILLRRHCHLYSSKVWCVVLRHLE